MSLINTNFILTQEEDNFCKAIAMGETYTKAFHTFFPERAAACKNPTSAAYHLTQKVQIAATIRKYVQAREKASIESMEWTREKSVETLNYVINVCKNDIHKIQQARKEELQFLMDCMDDPNNTPENTKHILQQMLKLQQKSDITKIQIAGIVDAVSELNLMHGYNENNVNMNHGVTFTGEDDILE